MRVALLFRVGLLLLVVLLFCLADVLAGILLAPFGWLISGFEFGAENFVDRLFLFGTELVGVVLEDDCSVLEEDDFVEDAFNVGNEMGRNQDAGAFVEVVENGVENVVARSGIDAAERFVEDVELGVATHDEDKLELFLHALAHMGDFIVEREVEILD